MYKNFWTILSIFSILSMLTSPPVYGKETTIPILPQTAFSIPAQVTDEDEHDISDQAKTEAEDSQYVYLPFITNFARIVYTGTPITIGRNHACALTPAGGVKCWGSNEYGQLGDGTTTDRPSPVNVVGLASGVQAVTAGEHHTCALTISGDVKCWGWNMFGQLGDETTTNRLTPVNVGGLTSGVQAISTGDRHTCALTTSGGVKCWGDNSSGQLGDGTTTKRLTPVDVVGLASDVVAVAAGAYHTCALTSTSGVKCWGGNYSGELGDGTTTTRLTPVDVVGLTSGVQAIAAGFSYTCALTTSGTIKCWGSNRRGQIGDGTDLDRLMPVDVIGLASDVQAIAAGGGHTCALITSGGVKCWGDNYYGQLGDGTTRNHLNPVDVVGLASGVQVIAAGSTNTCALTTSRSLKCWGDNSFGQLGNGTTRNHLNPVDAVGLTSGVQVITAGGLHTCALTIDGRVKCWGWNSSGQLGDGTTTDSPTPLDVVGLTSGVQAIAIGDQHTCALTTAGGVKCWGDNSFGQLGDGTTTPRLSPVDVSGLTSGVQAISTGDRQTCALTTSGGVKCWGDNSSGQLGDGTTTKRLTPVDVVGLASDVVAVAAGDQHTCALTTAGGVKCWGGNYIGQLGDGTITTRLTPVDVSGLTSGVQAISVGIHHTCALTTAGGVKCWGANSTGQLGDGTTNNRFTPVDVVGLTSDMQAISAGYVHTCALTTAGGVKCWGGNYSGELGDGTRNNSTTPVDVSGLTSGVQVIATGSYHTCALTTAGGVKCWGDNFYGQLGNGNAGYRSRPGDVVGWP